MNEVEYKGYKIVTDKPYTLKVIKPVGKGSVPKELRDRYTTGALAMQAIDAYQMKQVTKGGDTD